MEFGFFPYYRVLSIPTYFIEVVATCIVIGLVLVVGTAFGCVFPFSAGRQAITVGCFIASYISLI